MHTLSAADIRTFAKEGFLVVADVVAPDLVVRACEQIDELLREQPPDPDHRGQHFYFEPAARVPALLDLLTASPALEVAEALTGLATLRVPDQLQVSLNIPPYPHRPTNGHLDGLPEGSEGWPGTFTLLIGVLLTDQGSTDMGNLWVWPATHLAHADYFRKHGPGALVAKSDDPPIELPEPVQVLGRAGSVVYAHYLLAHSIGGNTSPVMRRAVYFRVRRTGHEPRWRAVIQDVWLEFDGVRAAVSIDP